MNKQKPPPKNGQISLPKKIAIIYSDVKRKYFPTLKQYLTEKGAKKDAETIASYLKKIGITPFLYPGNNNLPQNLKKIKPEMVINLVDSVKGNEYLSSTIPALLELLEIPYTGSGILGKSLDHNKFLIKKLLEQHGVPVPHYQLFNSPNDPLIPNLRFPLISKLNEIHGSVEIDKNAVSEDEKHLRERLKFLISTYQQPILVEEFIVGREITVILFEGLNKKIYSAEKIFHKKDNKYLFTTFDDQWETKKSTFHYQKYHCSILKEYVKKAFEITKMADYAKFDIRLDQSGRYFFIDCNSNPAFGPKENDCALSYILSLYGINFTEILQRLIINTMKD